MNEQHLRRELSRTTPRTAKYQMLQHRLRELQKRQDAKQEQAVAA